MDLTVKLLIVVIVSIVLMWMHFESLYKDIKKDLSSQLEIMRDLVQITSDIRECYDSLVQVLYSDSQTIEEMVLDTIKCSKEENSKKEV
nr:MAG TPA: hypothetical protein [Bacteriophage sp.]